LLSRDKIYLQLFLLQVSLACPNTVVHFASYL
jgi:hypothetical protein